MDLVGYNLLVPLPIDLFKNPMRYNVSSFFFWIKEDLLPSSIRNHLLTVAHNTRNYWLMAFGQVYIVITRKKIVIKGKLVFQHFKREKSCSVFFWISFYLFFFSTENVLISTNVYRPVSCKTYGYIIYYITYWYTIIRNSS